MGVGFLAQGCASSSSPTESRAPTPSPAVDTSKTGNSTGKTCTAGMTLTEGFALDGLAAGKQTIAADQMMVLYNGKQRSLCGILEDNGKKAGIFQFGGVLCSTCIKLGGDIQKGLAQSAYAKDIAHVMIMTDLPQDYPSDFEQRVQNFLSQVGGSPIRAQDNSAALWKSVRATSAARPVIAVNIKMEAEVMQEESQTGYALSYAEELVKTASTQ